VLNDKGKAPLIGRFGKKRMGGGYEGSKNWARVSLRPNHQLRTKRRVRKSRTKKKSDPAIKARKLYLVEVLIDGAWKNPKKTRPGTAATSELIRSVSLGSEKRDGSPSSTHKFWKGWETPPIPCPSPFGGGKPKNK